MNVLHSKGSYEIRFVSYDELKALVDPAWAMVTDANVARLYPALCPQAHVVPAGETSKNLEEYGRGLEWMAQSNLPRSGTVAALGGGVIGDLAGFLAATYMRGIACVQIPTTLLAQVDSSIGGKVGIDLPQGKNLAGSFHQPQSVLICTDLLKTLDQRQFANGMAEVWKYGFIADPALIAMLDGSQIHSGSAELEEVVKRCVSIKRDVVQADEFERTGLRATLNFGHTVGHAIEQATNYDQYLHGEAISIGMVVESAISEALGLAPTGTRNAVSDRLTRYGLPISSPILAETDQLLQAMRRDKKAKPGSLAMSLLTGIGECKLVEGVDESAVVAALREA